jgi:hypothetical protein
MMTQVIYFKPLCFDTSNRNISSFLQVDPTDAKIAMPGAGINFQVFQVKNQEHEKPQSN